MWTAISESKTSVATDAGQKPATPAGWIGEILLQ